MARPRTRDNNYNVFEEQAQSDKNSRHIVTPKFKPNREQSTHNGIEAQTEPQNSQTEPQNDREDTDHRALLLSDPDSKIKNPIPKPWKICGIGIMMLLLCVSAAILGYCLGNHHHSTEEETITEELEACRLKANTMKNALSHPDLLAELHKTYISMIHDRPTHWLQEYDASQPYSGSSVDQVLVHDIVNHLRKSAVFDEIKIDNYTILASLPDFQGSQIQVVNRTSGQVLYRRQILNTLQKTSYDTRRTHNKHNKHNLTQGHVPPFVAYSKAGTVEGEVVNINEGSESDFESLVTAGIILVNKIGLLKTGGAKATVEPLVDKILRAEAYNLSGVLVYRDSDTCDTTVDYDSLNIAGDPQTPGYASIDGVWRVPKKDVTFPEILTQTISCDTAHHLLWRMSGQIAPPGWQSSYNGTLYMGRKSNKADSWFIQLNTTNQYRHLVVQNVIATIRGFINPRQVIMLGASRNSFRVDHQGVLVSTDALLKLAHPLGNMLRTNQWLPKRSLTFSFWGGAEFGDIGRTEHMEQVDHLDEIVAYLDLDTPHTQLTSQPSVITPMALQEFVESVVHMRMSSLSSMESYNYDDTTYDDNDDDDDYQSSGQGVYDPIIGVFEKLQYIDPEDLPTLHWTLLPLIQMSTSGNNKASPSLSRLQQMEITRLHALLMLSLADQMVIQYNNVATARAIKAGIRRLNFIAYNLNDPIKVTLERHAARLYNNTAIFDHMIDNQMDYSVTDHVNDVNYVLIQLNKQLVGVQHKISKLLSGFPDVRPTPSDDLDLADDLDPTLLSYGADTMQQFSQLLLSIQAADDMMKTVHFQVISNNKTNATNLVDVSDDDYADLERGWV